MKATRQYKSKLTLLLILFIATFLPIPHVLGMIKKAAKELTEKVNQLSLGDTIDPELLELVFCNLSRQELVKLFVICKKWRSVAKKVFGIKIEFNPTLSALVSFQALDAKKKHLIKHFNTTNHEALEDVAFETIRSKDLTLAEKLFIFAGLVAKGLNVNAKDKHDKTLLEAAYPNERLQAMIISSRAKVYKNDQRLCKELKKTIDRLNLDYKKLPEIAKELFECCITNVNYYEQEEAITEQYFTSIVTSMKNLSPLIQYQWNLNYLSDEGDSIHHMLYKNRTYNASLLQEVNDSTPFSITEPNIHNNTAVIHIICFGSLREIKSILSKNPTLITATFKGYNLLQLAAATQVNRSVIAYLINELKFDKNVIDKDGYNLLQIASKWQNHPGTLQFLIDKLEFDKNVLTKKGNNILQIATAFNKNCNIIKYFIKTLQFDSSVKTKDGRSLLDIAKEYKNTQEVINYLKSRPKAPIGD